MSISQLSLTDFRNLNSTTLDFDAKLNFVDGSNGSGKTSLLEAIYVLCQAQSFRTHQIKQCINHDQTGFLLFGRFDNHKAGLSKNAQKLEIRVDGEIVKRRSDLVRKSPIQIVNAESFLLIEGSPARRRTYLDWCLFHVEQDYVDLWSQCQHALKQRNRLLKSKQDLNLIDYWDQHLVEPSLRLSSMRASYSKKLQRIIQHELSSMLQEVPVTLEYRPGWRVKWSLAEALQEQRDRDIGSGFTNSGVHRDELEIFSEHKKASEVLSRGQEKRVCLALLLGALKLVSAVNRHRIIFLIDDLHSELDNEARNLVYQQLHEMDLQLFISNIETAVPTGLQAKDFKMFHVEHGTIKPRNFS